MLHGILRSRSGRKHTALLVLLLLGTFAVTGVLTWIGQREGSKHAQSFESGLLTSAAFAAADYSEQVADNLVSFGIWSFRHEINSAEENDAPEKLTRGDPSGLDHVALRCGCDPAKQLAFKYSYDFHKKELAVEGPASPTDRARIAAVLADTAVSVRKFWRYSVSVTKANEPILFSLFRVDTLGNRIYAVGFGSSPKLLLGMLERVDTFNLNLPLPRENAEAMSDRFAIAVLAGQDTIFQGGEPSRYAVERKQHPAFGNITAIASVSPTRFDVVAGATAPMSPGPILIGLLLLVGVLITASVFLTRRQGELAQARTDFVSNVSHELRTPLAQIRMFAETLLLGRTRNDSERRRSLEIIDQEAKRLTALVDNVLQHARHERGATRVSPTETRLAPTVREAVEAFAQLPRSMNVDFRMELEDRLTATVDPGAFRQILNNLLDNAVKYGPRGQRVNVGLAMFEQHARLWVDDEGPGIPIRERERIFEPFFRSSVHSQSGVTGSGIGLAVVKELADLLEGRVWAEGAPGGGARLVVEFPNAYLQPEEAAGGWAVA